MGNFLPKFVPKLDDKLGFHPHGEPELHSPRQ